MQNSPQTAAGWFQDPNDASQWRWWDGAQWTNEVAPMQSQQQAMAVGAPTPQSAPALHAVGGGTPAGMQIAATPGASVVAAPPATADGVWAQPRYVISQKFMSIGARYDITLPTPESAAFGKPEPGQQAAHVQRKKLLSLKESIVFRDAQEQPVFQIAGKAVNMKKRYDICTPDGVPIAHLKKNVMGSFWRTSWRLLDTQERELAVAFEASSWHAFLRRFGGMLPFGEIASWIPYNFTITAGADSATPGQEIGAYRRIIGLRDKYDLDLRGDPNVTVDRRALLALAIGLDLLQNR